MAKNGDEGEPYQISLFGSHISLIMMIVDINYRQAYNKGGGGEMMYKTAVQSTCLHEVVLIIFNFSVWGYCCDIRVLFDHPSPKIQQACKMKF